MQLYMTVCTFSCGGLYYQPAAGQTVATNDDGRLQATLPHGQHGRSVSRVYNTIISKSVRSSGADRIVGWLVGLFAVLSQDKRSIVDSVLVCNRISWLAPLRSSLWTRSGLEREKYIEKCK